MVKTFMESFIMSGKSMTGLSLVAFLCLILVGCGSGEEDVAPAEVNTTVAAEPEIKGKKAVECDRHPRVPHRVAPQPMTASTARWIVVISWGL